MTRFIITKKMGAKFVINSLNEMKEEKFLSQNYLL